jgi:hypothetical protein
VPNIFDHGISQPPELLEFRLDDNYQTRCVAVRAMVRVFAPPSDLEPLEEYRQAY